MRFGCYAPQDYQAASLSIFPILDKIDKLGYEYDFYTSSLSSPYTPPYLAQYIKPHNLLATIKSYSHFLTTVPLPVASVEDLAVSTKLSYLCHLNSSDHVDSYPYYHAILCPSKTTYRYLRQQHHLTNLIYLPWASHLATAESVFELDEDHLAIYWPLLPELSEFTLASLTVIDHILQACPNIWITLTYSQDSQPLINCLRHLNHVGDGRLEIVQNPSSEEVAQLSYWHDLTVWTDLAADNHLLGLYSLANNTPVVAFDQPVIAELIKDNNNGYLVACELDDSTSIATVIPDYKLLAAKILSIVKQPEQLEKLHYSNIGKLAGRRHELADSLQDWLHENLAVRRRVRV